MTNELATTLPRRTLGRTGIEVPILGLGGLFVSGYGAAREQGIAAVRHALAAGIELIDTAPTYGDSEAVLGEALVGQPGPLVLSTKLGGRPQPFLPQDRDCLMRSLDESLRLLGRDRLDLLMVHEPDRPGQYDWWTDLDRAEGPVMDLLVELKQQGVIRAIGLGGTTCTHLARLVATGRFDVVLTAFNYSLLWREAAHEVLPAAQAAGVGVILGSPLQQGALARRYDEEVANPPRWLSRPRAEQFQALYRLVDDCGIPVPELALRFVAGHPQVDCVLTGARSPAEVDASLAAVLEGRLPQAVLDELDRIAALVPFRPICEPFGLPFGRDYHGPGQA